jgi:hypothetical protein
VSDDPELEIFLRRFRPRRPAPLGRPRPRRTWAVWATAAAVALALAGLFWQRGPAREHVPAVAAARPTLGVLNAALRAGRYEAALDELDARLLPDPARPGTALAALADVRSDLRGR